MVSWMRSTVRVMGCRDALMSKAGKASTQLLMRAPAGGHGR